MNKLLLIPVLLLAAACGDGPQQGDFFYYAEDLSEVWCERAIECGSDYWGPDDHEACVAYNHNSLCSLGTCADPVDPEWEADIEQCTTDLEEMECDDPTPQSCITAIYR